MKGKVAACDEEVEGKRERMREGKRSKNEISAISGREKGNA